jgi:predicted NAD/FAD-dependent oxidoreductase
MGESPSLGVIGAGVAGCALAAALRRGGWRGWIGLWEAGRGPGGRAATRRSRRDPNLAIDHGAPLFNIGATPAPTVLAPLRNGGWIEPWSGPSADLDGDGRLSQPSRDPLLAGELWHGCGGMDRLAHGLLELAEQHGPVERHWGHRVRRLERRAAGGWRLCNDEGEQLAEVDWLAISGSLLAHPRARELLGWPEVPLQEVAAATEDLNLQAAVAAMGETTWRPRLNLLLVSGAERAELWQQLPFRLLACGPEAQERWNLRRLIVQPLMDGRWSVVVHSSEAFAERRLPLLSTAAGEAATRRELADQLAALLTTWISPEEGAAAIAAAEAQLMRWGAAFPGPPGLDHALALCPASRIGFCGDYLAGEGFGRVEGALRSAESLAQRLLAISPGQSGRGCPGR